MYSTVQVLSSYTVLSRCSIQGCPRVQFKCVYVYCSVLCRCTCKFTCLRRARFIVQYIAVLVHSALCLGREGRVQWLSLGGGAQNSTEVSESPLPPNTSRPGERSGKCWWETLPVGVALSGGVMAAREPGRSRRLGRRRGKRGMVGRAGRLVGVGRRETCVLLVALR